MIVNSSFHTSMAGKFRAVINEGCANEIDTGWRNNLVLDSGLDRIGSAQESMFQYCSVGTGTTAPANGQTGLVSSLASVARSSKSNYNLGAPTYAAQYDAVYTFPQGAVTGNIAEFGVGWATGGGSLFSRCLIVDGSGSPTTLTLTTIDQLTVYYRLTLTPSITDSTGSVTLGGVSYPYTARIARAATFFSGPNDFDAWDGGVLTTQALHKAYPASSTIGSVTTEPSGSSVLAYSASVNQAAYTNGNFYRDATITLPPSDWNLQGGIGAIKMSFSNPISTSYYQAEIQYAFSTPIPKDNTIGQPNSGNTKTLSLTFRTSWGR